MHKKTLRYLLLTALIILTPVAVMCIANVVSAALQAPTITATKTDSLLVDIDGDSQADPGDTIRYTIAVTNSGTGPATNVNINDTIDSHTTLVPGSLRVSPVPGDDNYTATGNIRIAIGAPGVLANDYLGIPTAVGTPIAAFDATSANGGNVTLNTTDGSFTYNPPPGFVGVDTFTYTLTDNGSGASAANRQGTVSITVSNMIWFINNAALSPGDGRLSSPYNSLAAYNAAALDDPGDVIYFYQGSGNYTGGITLKNTQVLLGQGIDLATQLTALGITIDPNTDPALLPLPGITTKPTLVNPAGNGIVLAQNNTVRGLTVGNTTGTDLIGTNVGTLTTSVLSLNGSGAGISIDTGTLAVNLDEVSSSNTTGINLINNVTGTFNVTTGVINATNAPGVNIVSTSSVALGVTLQSVSSNNTETGIMVTNTTGSFTVTGTGAAGTGGTIQDSGTTMLDGAFFTNATNISLSYMNFTNANQVDAGGAGVCDQTTIANCNAAIKLANVAGITLDHVNITNVAEKGINGLTVSNFALTNSALTQCGNAANEGCLDLWELTGTSQITHSSFTSPGLASWLANLRNTTGTSNVTVSSSIFTSNTGLVVTALSSADMSVDAITSTFDTSGTPGKGLDFAAYNTATLNFNINRNLAIHSNGADAISLTAGDSAVMQGHVNDNPDIQVGGPGTSGIGVLADVLQTASMRVQIQGNTISQIGNDVGIFAKAEAGNGRLDATMGSNTITLTASSFAGIWVDAFGPNGTVCANMTNNAVNGTVPGTSFGLLTEIDDTTATMLLQGFNTDVTTTWNNNGNTPTGSVLEAYIPPATPGNGTCNLPTNPVAMAAPARVAQPTANSQALTADTPVQNMPVAATRVETPVSGSHSRVMLVQLNRSAARRSGETVTLPSAIPSLPPGKTVTIIFDVTVDAPLPSGTTQVCNQSTVIANGGISVLTDDPATGAANDPTCTPIVLPANPTLTKAFTPGTIFVSASSTLTLTLTNVDTTHPLTGVHFSDALPVSALGEIAYVPASIGGTCFGAPYNGSSAFSTTVAGNDTLTVTGITLSNATVGNNSCTITVNVQGNRTGTYNNVTGQVGSDQVLTTVTGTGTLIVTLPEPTITKGFAPNPVNVGTPSTLTLTVANTAAIPLTNVTFNDALPVTALGELNYVGPATGTCVGAPFNGTAAISTTTAANDTLTVNGVTLGAAGGGNDTCTVIVTVNTNLGGVFNNTTSVVTSTQVTGTATGSATLTVNAPQPTIGKNFAPDSIGVTKTSTLTFTIINGAAIQLTNASFSDVLPVTAAGELNYVGPATGTCVGAPFNGTAVIGTTTAANDTLTASGMTLGAAGGGSDTCTVIITVQGNAVGTYHNTTSVVTSTQINGTTTGSAALYVSIVQPIIGKGFVPATVGAGSNSTLTLSVANTAAIPLTNVTFSDALPVTALGELNYVGPATGTCVGAPLNGTAVISTTTAANDTLTVSGIALSDPGGGNDVCTVVVTVHANLAGTFPNTSSVVTSDQGTGTVQAQSTLTVTIPQPTLTKGFAPNSVNVGTPSTLTLTVANAAAIPLTNVTFNDALPVTALGELNYVGPATGTCVGAPYNGTAAISTTTAANDTLTVNSLTLGAAGGGNDTCTIIVTVNTNLGGVFNNTTSVVTAAEVTGTATGTDTLTVIAPQPTIGKNFAPGSIGVTKTSTLTFTIINGAAIQLTNASFSDALPVTGAGELNYVGPATGTCVGAPFNGTAAISTTTAANDTLAVNGMTLGAAGGGNDTCTVIITVQGNAVGTYNNTTSVVTSTQINGTTTGSAALNVVTAQPTIGKGFVPATAAVGSNSTLTFTVTNPAAIALTNASFSDALPVTAAGELNYVGPATGTCVGAPFNGTAVIGTTTAANDTLTVSGIALSAIGGGNDVCTVVVTVHANLAGTFPNTSSVVTSDQGTGTVQAQNTLTVTIPQPTLTKGFVPNPVNVGTPSTLTLTVTNAAAIPLTNVTFNDALPVTALGEIAYLPASIGGTCLNVPYNAAYAFSTTTAANDTLTVNSLTLGAAGGGNDTCTITVTVNTNLGGVFNNTTSVVTSTEVTGTATGNATLTVIAPQPTINKGFAPSTVSVGSTSTLTLTLANTAGIALTNASFSDALPVTALAEIAYVPASVGGTCLSAPFNGAAVFSTTTAANDTLTVSGMTLGAAGGGNETCTVTVTINTSRGGTFNNATSVVTSDQIIGTTTGTDTLTVNAPQPTVSKQFAPAALNVGSTSTLTFTVANTAGIALTNASFSDALPVTAAGEIAYVPASVGGTCLSAPFNATTAFGTTTAANDTLTVTGMALGAAGGGSDTCTITVTINTSRGGTFNNVTSVVTSDQITGTATGSATLTVTAPEPTVIKQFTPATINVGGTTTLNFTLTNGAGIALTNASFNDPLPVTAAGEIAYVPASVGGTCVGAPFNGTTAFATTVAANDTLTLSGVALAANGSPDSTCTLTVSVTGNLSGVFNNQTSVVTSDQINGTTRGTATLNVIVPINISKAFSPAQINRGATSMLTITVSNGTGIALTNAQFTDALPVTAAGELSYGPASVGTCLNAPFNGVAAFSTTVAANDTLQVTGISLAASGADATCTVTVEVRGSADGTYTNTTSVVTSDQGTGTVTGSANLRVGQPQPPTQPTSVPAVTVFDPALSKTGVLEPGQLGLPGEHLTWVIVATNNGNLTGTNIVITDVIASEMRIDSVESNGASYTVNGQTVTFTIPSLAPGQQVEMRIHVTVLRSPANGDLVNTAMLTGSGQTRTATGLVVVPTTMPGTGYPPAKSHNGLSVGWLLAGAALALVAVALGGRLWRSRRTRKVA